MMMIKFAVVRIIYSSSIMAVSSGTREMLTSDNQ